MTSPLSGADPPTDPQAALTALAVALADLRGDVGTGLAGIRGDVGTGFAEVRGVLDVLRQSDSHTGQTLTDHTATLADHERRLVDGERARAGAEEVRTHDRRRVAMVSAVVGIAAGVLTALVTALALIRP
ncbi:hypothetical protein ABT093_35960 [Kitasatospora sp. NPDC002551]|uniref:hypothetical protein n=1 Tax=Kitasatospora sp. NPDC002551 TaxID=3154539 RepID=UPI00331A8D12